jgi:hypothetical protein
MSLTRNRSLPAIKQTRSSFNKNLNGLNNVNDVFVNDIFVNNVFVNNIFVNNIFVNDVFVNNVFINDVFVNIFVNDIFINDSCLEIIIANEYKKNRKHVTKISSILCVMTFCCILTQTLGN